MRYSIGSPRRSCPSNSSRSQRAKAKAKWGERDLHFHDLRGTAATKFYIGGLSVRVIAEVMAWEEETIEKIYPTGGIA